MANELEDQIRTYMERGIRPVSAEDIERRRPSTTAFPARAGRVTRSRRVASIAVGFAAVGCAAVLVATQLGGPGPRPAVGHALHKAPVVLTATAVQRLEAASRLALAHAGRAVLSERQTVDGVLQERRTDDIRFTGQNWNDSFSESVPARSGEKAFTESAINRVVGGQAYDHFVAADGLAWYHETGPNAVNSMHIPDPRKLMAELAPGAGFVKAAQATVGGVLTEHLTATVLTGLPSINLPNLSNQGTPAALDVWVDAHGVIRKMSVSFRQTLFPGTMTLGQLKHLPKGTKIVGLNKIPVAERAHIRAAMLLKSGSKKKWIVELKPGAVTPQTQVTTLTVSFRGMGQRQVIRVPAHAIPSRGLG
jgi:hypothetical protein